MPATAEEAAVLTRLELSLTEVKVTLADHSRQLKTLSSVGFWSATALTTILTGVLGTVIYIAYRAGQVEATVVDLRQDMAGVRAELKEILARLPAAARPR